MSPLEYMERFNDTELAAIYSAAKVNVAVEVWLKKFERSTEVNLDDPRTVAGVQALESAGLIGEGRANEILGLSGGGAPVAGFAVGDQVRPVAPFNVGFPDTYSIEGFEGGALLIAGGVSFEPQFVEKV